MSETPKGQQQNLADSLANVMNILLGEKFDALNKTVQALESKVNKQLEESKKDTAQRLEKLEKETGKKIDDLSRSLETFGKVQDDARTKLEDYTNKSIAEVRTIIGKTEESVNNSMNAIRSAMEKELLAQQERIYNQFNAIEEHLESHQSELTQRGRETRRISALMSNFAKVLTEVNHEDLPPAPDAQISKIVKVPKPVLETEKTKMPPTLTDTEAQTKEFVRPETGKDEKPQEQQIEIAENDELPTSDDIDASMDNMFSGGKK